MSFNSNSVTTLSNSDDERYEVQLARRHAKVETLLRQQKEKKHLEHQARKGKTLGGKGATMSKAESKKRDKGSREKEIGERTEEASRRGRDAEKSRRGRDMEKRGRMPERFGLLY